MARLARPRPMTWQTGLTGFLAGLLISVVTAPVGVSGAVFLPPRLRRGTGGLIGGHLGARLQPRVPERALRLLLGSLATAFAAIYLTQSIT